MTVDRPPLWIISGSGSSALLEKEAAAKHILDTEKIVIIVF